jgi:hypothetical protein
MSSLLEEQEISDPPHSRNDKELKIKKVELKK